MSAEARDLRAVGGARYSLGAIVLHWTIALAIVLQVLLAWRMGGARTPETFAIFQLHKSLGITILLLSLVRLAWRLTRPPPPLPATMPRWEKLLARATHVGFYVVMVGMPLTGWLMVSTSRIQVPTLLYGTVPWPDLPMLPHLAPAAKAVWNKLGALGHETLAYGLYVLLALHVAGALKHQLFGDDEPVLARMAPGAVTGRWLEWRLLVIVAAFVGVIAFGELVQPPVPAMSAAPPPAAAPAPVVEAPATAAPGPELPAPAAGPELVRWRVGPGSTLSFGTAWSGAPIQGRFDKWQAGIVFSPELLEQSKVTAVIDLTSVNTGDQQRDQTLPSADWFDAAAHPQAEFRAERFEKTGEGRYVAHGTLSLRGVKKPLDLPFRLTIDGKRAEMTGSASLDRTAFGIGQGEFAATDQIPAKVTVRVELHAIRD